MPFPDPLRTGRERSENLPRHSYDRQRCSLAACTLSSYDDAHCERFRMATVEDPIPELSTRWFGLATFRCSPYVWYS